MESNAERKLYQAAGDGNVEGIKDILRKNPNLDVNWGESSYTALQRASCDGHDSVVSILLAHPDIDVNKKNKFECTPFMFACVRGHTSCVRLLLKDQRVNPNEPDHTGRTPLWFAAYDGHPDVIRCWIASGREMYLGQPGKKKTDAIWAAKNPRAFSTVEKMKAQGLEIAALLERFKENPEKTRSEIRKELGITGEFPGDPASCDDSFFTKGFSACRFSCDHPTHADQRAICCLP